MLEITALNSDWYSKIVQARVKRNQNWGPLNFLIPNCTCRSNKLKLPVGTRDPRTYIYKILDFLFLSSRFQNFLYVYELEGESRCEVRLLIIREYLCGLLFINSEPDQM
jgi:hypothetical protein